MRLIALAAILPAIALGQPAPTPSPEPPAALPEPSVVEVLRAEAGRVMPLVRCSDSQRFLIGTTFLPAPAERTLYVNAQTREWLTAAAFEERPEGDRAGFTEKKISEKQYYYTKYGSPIAYARPVDLLCQTLGGGYAPIRGKRILDFGYGGVGHLRLIAALGCEVVGVEVDPFLHALYSDPSDTGAVDGVAIMDDPCPTGKLTLLHGRWPAEERIVAEAGAGFDVILSKNTLKNGYLNPEHPVDKRLLVDLGVAQEEFLAKVAASLKTGGLFMIYNICPAQNPDPAKWIPWADGRSPFSREMFDAAGFEIIAFDQVDDEIARKMGEALEWNKGDKPMDLEHDLFALYTIVRKLEKPAEKPVAPKPASD